MKKKNVWVSSDGKEFTDQAECLEHERVGGFLKASIKFVEAHLDVSNTQAAKLVEQLSDFWDLIRDNPDEFQEVLDLAKPKKLRGRPPATKKKKVNEIKPVEKIAVPQVTKEEQKVPEITFGHDPEVYGPNRGGDAFDYAAEEGLPPAVPDDLSQAEPVEGVEQAPAGPPAPWRAGGQ